MNSILVPYLRQDKRSRSPYDKQKCQKLCLTRLDTCNRKKKIQHKSKGKPMSMLLTLKRVQRTPIALLAASLYPRPFALFRGHWNCNGHTFAGTKQRKQSRKQPKHKSEQWLSLRVGCNSSWARHIHNWQKE